MNLPKQETRHLNNEINTIYELLKKIDVNEKSNVASVLSSFTEIKEYLCRASEMKSEAEDLLLIAKKAYREREAQFQADKSPDGRQYDYKDRKNVFCTNEEIELERLEYFNKRLDRLRDDIKTIIMQLNVLQSYFKAEIKAGLGGT